MSPLKGLIIYHEFSTQCRARLSETKLDIPVHDASVFLSFSMLQKTAFPTPVHKLRNRDREVGLNMRTRGLSIINAIVTFCQWSGEARSLISGRWKVDVNIVKVER